MKRRVPAVVVLLSCAEVVAAAIRPPIDLPPKTSPSHPSMFTTFNQVSRSTDSLSRHASLMDLILL